MQAFVIGIAYNNPVSRFFANFPQALMSISATHILITPNERLARELRAAHDELHRQSGRRSWATLTAMSVEQFFRREWLRMQDLGHADKEIVPQALLSQLAWQFRPDPALSNAAMTDFLDAWHTIHRFHIDLHHPLYQQPRLTPFAAWFRAVKDALPGHYIPAEDIPSALLALGIPSSRPLFLDHIDQLSANELSYFRQAAQHTEVVQRQSPNTQLPAWHQGDGTGTPVEHPETTLTPCLDLREEISHAASWAARQKAKQPDAAIGIVVPKLAQNYDLVKRACGAILDPANGSQSPAFDISAGQPLSSHPGWLEAKLMLQLAIEGLRQPQFDTLLASRFLQLPGWQSYLSPRRRIYLSQQMGQQVDLPAVCRILPGPLSEQLTALTENWPKTNSYGGWINHFVALLHTCGWPNTSQAGSARFQTVQAIRNTLEELTGTAAISKPIAADLALRWVDFSLSRIQFAPERSRADIQILGTLETTGLQFSHLWVCGLDENSFPGKPNTNPFIPPAIAAQFQVPMASSAQALQLAEQQLQQWHNNSGQLKFSFTRIEEDSPQEPCGLLDRYPRQPSQVSSTHPYWCPEVNSQRIIYQDNRGTPLLGDTPLQRETEAETESGLPVAPGGAGLLKTQAECGFKAYATYRLKLRQQRPVSDLPDALQRGIILHDVFEQLFKACSNSADLAQLSGDGIRQICRTTLARAEYNLPELFVPYEVERLTHLVSKWLHLEKQRAPFEAIHLEQEFTLTLGKLNLRLRIDRIDHSADHLLVLDYKSGRVSVQNSRDLAKQEPQLPLYCLVDGNIRGVYFAEVREEGVRLLGVSETGKQLQSPTKIFQEQDWPALVEHWRSDLLELAEEVSTGKAEVSPSPQVCRFCHLASFCRMRQMA